MWNLCVQLDNEYQRQYKKSINQTELQRKTKKCVPLHSKNIQHVVHKYLFARDSTWKSISAKHNNSHKVKLPYKNKKYFTSGWDYQSIRVDYDNGIIMLSKPKTMIDGKMRILKPIKCHSKSIPQNIVEVELVWRGRLYLAVKYKEHTTYKQIKSDNVAAIDLGEIHAVASMDNNGNAVIITGRQMRSYKRFRNKQQAELRAKMSKCTKDSKQWSKYQRAMDKVAFKSKRKTNDALHKITKHYVDYCVVRDIKRVYYGDLDSLTRNSKQNNVGHTFTRQKINQWEYGELIKLLEPKLSRHGIELIKVKEYYTSQKCPKCKNLNKPMGRNYVCGCGYTQHRDVVGAMNILNDNAGTNIQYYQVKKYLQIA